MLLVTQDFGNEIVPLGDGVHLLREGVQRSHSKMV